MSLPHCKYEGRFQLIHSTEQNPRMTMTTGCMWWTLKTGLASLDIFMVVGSVHMSKNKLFTHHGYHENLTSCGLILKLQCDKLCTKCFQLLGINHEGANRANPRVRLAAKLRTRLYGRLTNRLALLLLDGWARPHPISTSDCKRAFKGGRRRSQLSLQSPDKGRTVNQCSQFDLVELFSFSWKI